MSAPSAIWAGRCPRSAARTSVTRPVRSSDRSCTAGALVFIGRARTPDARARMLLLSRAYERIGHCHYQVGRSLPTVCASLLNLNSSEQAGPSIELARSYGTQILGAGMVGQHRMARMYMRLARHAEGGITDQAALGWVDLMAVTYLVGAGAWAEMDEIIPRATALQEALGDRRRLQETVMVGACGDYFRGRFAQSLTASERVWSLAVDAEGWQPRVWSTAGLVQAGLVIEPPTRCAAGGQPGRGADVAQHRRVKGGAGPLSSAGGQSRGGAHRGRAGAGARPRRRRWPAMFRGLRGATEVQIALRARAGSPEHERGARAARRGLSTIERFAGMFPVGEPRAALSRPLRACSGETPKPPPRSSAAGQRASGCRCRRSRPRQCRARPVAGPSPLARRVAAE